MKTKVLIVIPARGGSKGIPRKNLRTMNGKPLIYYTINNAKQLKLDNFNFDIVVSSDDIEILDLAEEYGVNTVKRPTELAKDDITLDSVIFHVLNEMENIKKYKYDIVITMQPTSPTLKSKSLINSIKYMIEEDKDTIISVVNDPHLSWKEDNGKIIPNFKERLNRQQLPNYYKETGGFLISKREYVTQNSRLGKNIDVYRVDKDEAIDIDNELDWIACESILRQKKIVFRVDGEEKLGMGHIYRCLTLAYQLIGHNIYFITKSECNLGVKKLKESFFKLNIIDNNKELYNILNDIKPDIIINDILNTSKEYMEKLRKYAKRIINFEDKGDGADLADVVINALYEDKHMSKRNTFNGFKYFYIRDEFLMAKQKIFTPIVENLLIMFGGSDPSNLTEVMYNICKDLNNIYPNIKFNFITGFGYQHKDRIITIKEKNIYVYNDVKRVSKFMEKADLAITSQGRTIYELAYMGIPSIVLAQNQRETEHLFANIKNGFINLGIGYEQDKETIIKTLKWLIDTPQVRKEMKNPLIEKELRKGQNRVKELIFGDLL